jgi:hypothetical protein
MLTSMAFAGQNTRTNWLNLMPRDGYAWLDSSRYIYGAAATYDIRFSTKVTANKGLTIPSGATFTIDAGATVVSTAAVFMNITGADGLTVTYGVTAGSFTTTGDAAVGTLTSAGAATATTLDTGQGANELYDMDQNVLQASAVTFATVDTGQGANELYDMNQNVQTSNAVSFAGITNTAGFKTSYVLMSDSGTLTASSATVVNASRAGGQEIILPTAGSNAGLSFTVKKTGSAGAVTLTTVSGETIDGVDNNVEIDAANDFLTIVSDGTNWIVVSRYIQ